MIADHISVSNKDVKPNISVGIVCTCRAALPPSVPKAMLGQLSSQASRVQSWEARAALTRAALSFPHWIFSLVTEG